MRNRKEVMVWTAVLLAVASVAFAAQEPASTRTPADLTPDASALALEIFGPPSPMTTPNQNPVELLLEGTCCGRPCHCSCFPVLCRCVC